MAIHKELQPRMAFFEETKTFSMFKKINGVYWGYSAAATFIGNLSSFVNPGIFHSLIKSYSPEEVEVLQGEDFDQLMLIKSSGHYWGVTDKNMIRWLLRYPNETYHHYIYFLNSRRARTTGVESYNPVLWKWANELSIKTLPGNRPSFWKNRETGMGTELGYGRNAAKVLVGVAWDSVSFSYINNTCLRIFRDEASEAASEGVSINWAMLEEKCAQQKKRLLEEFYRNVQSLRDRYPITVPIRRIAELSGTELEGKSYFWDIGSAKELFQDETKAKFEEYIHDNDIEAQGFSFYIKYPVNIRSHKPIPILSHIN